MAAEVRDLREYRRKAAEARVPWPAACWVSEERFGRRVARLYPLLGVENGVRTPQGIGTLLQVFSTGCQVLLMKTRATAKDLNGKPYRPTTEFEVEEIEPYGGGGS